MYGLLLKFYFRRGGKNFIKWGGVLEQYKKNYTARGDNMYQNIIAMTNNGHESELATLKGPLNKYGSSYS